MDITDAFQSEPNALDFLLENSMIHTNRTCQCSGIMTWCKKRGKPVWVCPMCNTTTSIFHGSFFQVNDMYV
jgi:hypothetical protein